MKVLVTGGAGFIGSHLVDRLVLADLGEIVVLDNLYRGKPDYLKRSIHAIKLVVGDIRDCDLLMREMANVDLVYHLAAQSNVLGAFQDLDYSFQTNVIGTYEVLKAAKAAGVRRVVFSSSREVYGENTSVPVSEAAPLAPINPYGASKAAGEMYCRTFGRLGLEVVVLRLANVYGPRDRDRVIPLFAEKAINGEPLTVFGGSKILDFLWIDDLTDVLLETAQCPWPITPVNVGSGKGTSLVELAERICLLTGRQSHVRVAENRSSEVARFVADVSTAQRLFGLMCPEDPIGRLPQIIEELCCEV